MGTEEDDRKTAGGGRPGSDVGPERSVRRNAGSDRFRVFRFHHAEFWSSDATNVSRRFSAGLGIPVVAKSDVSTGNLVHSSYLLCLRDIKLLFSAAYSPSLSASQSSIPSIPSFSHSTFQSFVGSHGFGVRALAVEVEDAESAFHISVSHGAKPYHPAILLGAGDETKISEVCLCGDVVLRYVSFRTPRSGDACFLPGFRPVQSQPVDYGLRRIDHAVANVPDLAAAVQYLKRLTGFHEFAEFTAAEVGTAESGLNSVVLANDDESVLLPINEPVNGKRRSQIQTYLEHNDGAGIQHLAFTTDDIFRTLRQMQAPSGGGGFEFMPAPLITYYENLRPRAGDILTAQQIEDCQNLGILVDRDDQGILLQIFTKPVGDRPTIFLEIIQRICGTAEELHGGGQVHRGSCGGFGKGNFHELFKSVEAYESSFPVSYRPKSSL